MSAPQVSRAGLALVLLACAGCLGQSPAGPARPEDNRPAVLPAAGMVKALDERKSLAAAFLEKARTAPDPAALAVEAAKDRTPADPDQPNALNLAGMQWLAQHPDDPRAEATLAEIAGAAPKRGGMTVSYAAANSLRALRRQKLQKQAQELGEKARTSGDPVALAVKAAQDKFPGEEPALTALNAAGMKLLSEHWEDPRSEQTLERLTHGPVVPDESEQVATKAAELLGQVRARKGMKALLAGAATPAERVAAVRKAFAEHPDWLKNPPGEMLAMREALVAEAVASGGASVADLVVQSRQRQIMCDFGKRYPEEYVAVVQKIGRRQALDNPYCLDALRLARSDKALATLEAWIKEEPDAQSQSRLTNATVSHPGAEKALLLLLEDNRFAVSFAATMNLHQAFPSESAAAAIEAAAARRKAAGAPSGEVQPFLDCAGLLRAELKRKAAGPTPVSPR